MIGGNGLDEVCTVRTTDGKMREVLELADHNDMAQFRVEDGSELGKWVPCDECEIVAYDE